MVRMSEAAKASSITRQSVHNYVLQGVVSIDAFAYENYGIILVDLEEVVKVSKERAELRIKRRPKTRIGRKSKKEKEGVAAAA